jgi:hypothetical protein
MTKYYKFLDQKDGEIKSHFGDHIWTIGATYETEGELKICESGFHASDTPIQALSFVKGNVLALVSVGDDTVDSYEKISARSMKIERAFRWTRKDSIALAIYAASLTLKIFEKHHLEDKRPRKAIAAARRYLKTPSEENRIVAYDATNHAAYAAAYATSVAWLDIEPNNEDLRFTGTSYAAFHAASSASYAANAASYAANAADAAYAVTAAVDAAYAVTVAVDTASDAYDAVDASSYAADADAYNSYCVANDVSYAAADTAANNAAADASAEILKKINNWIIRRKLEEIV